MMPFRTIIHPTDFSEPSTNGLHLACALARDYHAHLIVLHVMAPPSAIFAEGVAAADSDDACAEATDLLNQLEIPATNLNVTRQLAEGDPGTVILNVAQERNADLIVLGTHGRGGLARLLMGGVADLVVRKAPCPVLTVREPVASSEIEETAPNLAVAAAG